MKNDQVSYLLNAIAELKEDGVTGETIVWSFVSQGVQPLKQEAKPGWTFLGSDITKDVPDLVTA